ncbi:MAG: hypothetical protein ABL883_07900 [Terricaulis sp.]
MIGKSSGSKSARSSPTPGGKVRGALLRARFAEADDAPFLFSAREDKGMDGPFNSAERKQAHLAIVRAQILGHQRALEIEVFDGCERNAMLGAARGRLAIIPFKSGRRLLHLLYIHQLSPRQALNAPANFGNGGSGFQHS